MRNIYFLYYDWIRSIQDYIDTFIYSNYWFFSQSDRSCVLCHFRRRDVSSSRPASLLKWKNVIELSQYTTLVPPVLAIFPPLFLPVSNYSVHCPILLIDCKYFQHPTYWIKNKRWKQLFGQKLTIDYHYVDHVLF